MALRQLLNRSCNSPDAVFRTIRDFLAAANGIDDFTAGGQAPGPGYEIVDASYASGNPSDTTVNDWCVLKSSGEANSYPHYMRLDFGSLQHKLNPYLHWDSNTHTGKGGMTYTNIYHNGAGISLLYIHADLDEIHIVIRPQGASQYYLHQFGRIKPENLAYNGVATRAPDAVAPGANTVIALESWPDWARAGRKVYNWDTSSMHELTIVATNPADRTITVQTSYTKAAGSLLVEDMLFFATNSYSNYLGGNNTLAGLPLRSGNNLLENGYMTICLPNYAGVDTKYGERIGVAVSINRTDEYRGTFALMRDSNTAPAAQGEAWVDVTGAAWRVYTVYSNRTILLREAI